MNIINQRNLYLVLIAFFVAIILASAYYLLGGFEEVRVYQLAPTTRIVAGKYFDNPETKAAYDHVQYCGELVYERKIDGIPTEVIYLNDSITGEEAGAFIGISLNEDIAEIPVGFDVREFESDVRFAVFLTMHFIVQPTRTKIESMLYNKAQEEGYELKNYFFVLNYQDGSRSVEGWVKH